MLVSQYYGEVHVLKNVCKQIQRKRSEAGQRKQSRSLYKQFILLQTFPHSFTTPKDLPAPFVSIYNMTNNFFNENFLKGLGHLASLGYLVILNILRFWISWKVNILEVLSNFYSDISFIISNIYIMLTLM